MPMLVAIVSREAEICFVAVARTSFGLRRRLGEYVRRSTSRALFSDDAQAVGRLLRDRDVDTAIERYFGATHWRWDRERLRIEIVDLEDDPSMAEEATLASRGCA